ncbi:hypothetical protein S2091_2091 [Solimicrobium silvestre]|uniref:Uncharacterized protein n=1 Tax=Solimicrobium silvestre TaxID=2099400 RepID=A0A2S9H074_9BURK|nr:hypothetical protein S2091_2091 [Solimicrobium silvestre]
MDIIRSTIMIIGNVCDVLLMLVVSFIYKISRVYLYFEVIPLYLTFVFGEIHES